MKFMEFYMSLNEAPEPDHLAEWNRLNIENAENRLVSVIFENMIESTKFFDNYSTWLTVGTGAAMAFLIANVSSVLPFLTPTGYKLSGLMLVLSILFGVLSKFFAIQCQVSDAQNESKTNRVGSALAPYFEEAQKISEMAKQQHRTLTTDLSMERVFVKFCEPFPFWFKWMFLARMKKNAENPLAGYLIPLRFFRLQCSTMFLQVCLLLGSAVCAFIYA